MTVAEVVAALSLLDPDATVAVFSRCHDCGGEDVQIEQHPDRNEPGRNLVEISGDEIREPWD